MYLLRRIFQAMFALQVLCTALLNLEGAASTPPSVSLSLAEAQARAAAYSPEVALAAGRVRAAEATRVGAGLRTPVNPRISADARPGLDAATRGDVGYAAGLDVLLEVNDAPGARVREAGQRTRAAQADASVARLDARLQATELYVAVQLAQVRIDHIKETINLAERLLAAARERRASGAAGDIDVTSAGVELAERRAQLRQAEADRLRVDGELRYVLGLPSNAAVHLTSSVDAPERLPALAALLGQAQQNHPDLAAIQERINLLASSEERLRKEAQPKVGVFGALDASPASPVFGVVGMSVELPLFQRNQGPRAVAAAERNMEADRLQISRRRIDQMMRATHAAYDLRLAELEVLAREGIPAAEERLRLVEQGWRAGRFDVFRLVAAAQDLARLRFMRVDVIERIWQERLILERLTGGWSK
jgi:cobalt-zinc-cadmium efflux system outer membrane protein